MMYESKQHAGVYATVEKVEGAYTLEVIGKRKQLISAKTLKRWWKPVSEDTLEEVLDGNANLIFVETADDVQNINRGH